jgi:hypothetical protein
LHAVGEALDVEKFEAGAEAGEEDLAVICDAAARNTIGFGL